MRVLQQLLAEGAFEGVNTSPDWIRSITCISSPLNGSLAVYTLGAREAPLGRILPSHAAPPTAKLQVASPEAASPEPTSCLARAFATLASAAAHVTGWHQPVRCCSAGYTIGMFAHVWELIDLPHLHEGVFHFDVARFGVGRRRRGMAAAALHCATAGCPVGAGSRLFQHANCAPADMTLQGAYLWNRRIQHHDRTYYFSFVGDSFGQEEAKGAAHDVTGVKGGQNPAAGAKGACDCETGCSAPCDGSTPRRRSVTSKSTTPAPREPSPPRTDVGDPSHCAASSAGKHGPTRTASAGTGRSEEHADHASGARTVLRLLQWHVGWHTPWMDKSCFPFVVHPGTGEWGPSAWRDGGGDGLLSLPEQAVPLHTPARADGGVHLLMEGSSHVQSGGHTDPVTPTPPPFLLVDTPPVRSEFSQWLAKHSVEEATASKHGNSSPLTPGLRFTPRPGLWHVLRHGSDHVGVVPAPVGSLPQAGFFSRLWRLLDEVDEQCR